jgi:hypothetical protein
MRWTITLLTAIAGSTASAQEFGCKQEERDLNTVIAVTVRDCVRDNTLALEKSAESPQDIATSAQAFCAEGFRELEKGCGGYRMSKVMKERLREESIAKVVSIRADKHQTKQPAPRKKT